MKHTLSTRFSFKCRQSNVVLILTYDLRSQFLSFSKFYAVLSFVSQLSMFDALAWEARLSCRCEGEMYSSCPCIHIDISLPTRHRWICSRCVSAVSWEALDLKDQLSCCPTSHIHILWNQISCLSSEDIIILLW